MPPLLSRITPRRLPAYALNGIAVAIGVGGVQLLFAVLGGATAAQLASSGAVCTSLADVPNTVGRTWQRVVAAALLAVLASASAALLQPHPAALGAVGAAVRVARRHRGKHRRRRAHAGLDRRRARARRAAAVGARPDLRCARQRALAPRHRHPAAGDRPARRAAREPARPRPPGPRRAR